LETYDSIDPTAYLGAPQIGPLPTGGRPLPAEAGRPQGQNPQELTQSVAQGNLPLTQPNL